MTKQESVSLCMIVKDEEKVIQACLDSIRHLVDEIIVVDTGSSDNTVKLATQAGAKVCSYTWKGNFAEARNFALEHASGSWILVLDADEELAPVSPEAFRQLLEVEEVEGYFIQINNFLGPAHYLSGSNRLKTTDQVVRLFRNKLT